MSQSSVGYQHYRTRNNWRELAISETWEEYRQLSSSRSADLVELILSNSEEFKNLSHHEQLAAIRGFTTAIQWLGTNVGNCFLEKMLEAMGREAISTMIEERLTSSSETVRCQAAFMKSKIEDWKKRTGEDA